PQAQAGRDRATASRGGGDIDCLDRSFARGGGRGFPRESHSVPPGDGGPRQVRPALSGMWNEGATDPARGERDELLPHVPEWRTPAGRPRAFAFVEGRLAQYPGGDGGISPGPARGGWSGTVRRA